MAEAERLLELTAQIPHDDPDYTGLHQIVEQVSDPWAALEGVLRRVHAELL